MIRRAVPLRMRPDAAAPCGTACAACASGAEPRKKRALRRAEWCERGIICYFCTVAGIYFHIPFCRRICTYCDFPRSADLRPMRPLLDAMHRELDARADALRGASVRTLYFGAARRRSARPGSCRSS